MTRVYFTVYCTVHHLKILLCSDSYYPHPGGVSEYLYYLGTYLRTLGHTVTILAPHYAEAYRDDDHTKRIGRCYYITANMATITITFHPRLPFLVRDYLRTQTFDIVHTNGPLGYTLPYWAFHYSNSVNVATFHTAFTGLNLYRFAKVLFKKEFRRKKLAAVYPSRKAYSTTYPHFPTDCRVIPNGIDTTKFNPGVRPLDKFPAAPKILFLGRLDPRKGFVRLLAAFPLIKKRLPHALLIVVGSGPLQAQYERMIPETLRNSVFFEGRVSADLIPRYYATADVYVSPATGGEVFGIVLTEAMASGTPVVASNIPGYNEVVRHGKNGLLFDVNEIHDIADKITAVLTNRSLSMSLRRTGRQYAESISWQNVARMVEDYYVYLIKKHGNE